MWCEYQVYIICTIKVSKISLLLNLLHQLTMRSLFGEFILHFACTFHITYCICWQWRDIAYCLNNLTLSEKGIKKLLEENNFKVAPPVSSCLVSLLFIVHACVPPHPSSLPSSSSFSLSCFCVPSVLISLANPGCIRRYTNVGSTA